MALLALLLWACFSVQASAAHGPAAPAATRTPSSFASYGGQDVVMTSMHPADEGVRKPTVYPAPKTAKLQQLDTPTACPGAFHYLRPQDGAPPNGGTVRVGQKFTFDLMINPAA